MPAAFERRGDELGALRLFVDAQRADLLAQLDGLTDDEARSKPTVSELSLFGIVKHCAFVERRWVLAGIGDREIPGIYPAVDRDQEFRPDEGEDVEWLRRFYATVAADNDALLDALADVTATLGNGLDPRWVLLHLIEELARHAGQADIIRESIDDAKGV
jgi:hypothetical protein